MPRNDWSDCETGSIRELLLTFPPLEDKARIELINSFQVVGDHIRARKQARGLLTRFWESATGVDHDRINDVLHDTHGALELLHRQVNHLEAEKVRTLAGMKLMASALKRLDRDLDALKSQVSAVRDLASRLQSLEDQFGLLDRKIDAIVVIEDAASDLRAGLYGHLPPLVQLMLAVENVAWRAEIPLAAPESTIFTRAVHAISDAAATAFGTQRRSFVSIAALVREACRISPTEREAMLLLNDYGRNPASVGTLLLDASAILPEASAAEVESLITCASGRFAMPLESLVRRLLLEARHRIECSSQQQQPALESGEIESEPVAEVLPPPVSVEMMVGSVSELHPGPTPGQRPSIGLVISGGGAKGAYVVGVLQAMAEYGLQPAGVAGTSIGALNGAIVASCGDIHCAATTLHDVWQHLAQASPVCLNPVGVSAVLAKAVLMTLATRTNPYVAPIGARLSAALERYAERNGINLALLSAEPISKVLHRYVDVTRVNEWLPLWVASFRGTLSEAVWEGFKGYVLGMDNRNAEFFRVQETAPEQIAPLLLASAALPILYPSQTLGGETFFDGGIGGARRQRGNTPIAPLIEAGCKHCIVIHLSNGSLWTRHEYPGVQVLEIRPSRDLAPEGCSGMLNFSREKIAQLIHLGYVDASRVLGDVRNQLYLSHVSRMATLSV